MQGLNNMALIKNQGLDICLNLKIAGLVFQQIFKKKTKKFFVVLSLFNPF